MVKSILLAGTMIVAAPVLAQAAPTSGRSTATPTQTAPAASTTAAPTATTAPQSAQAGPAAPAGTTPTTAAPAQSAQADPGATTGASAANPNQQQVAQVVDQQFATYDKDGDGSLSKAEFSAWMTALKSSSPAAGKESPAQQTAWNEAAFKQADGDKSATVTKTELTGFLVKGASQPS